VPTILQCCCLAPPHHCCLGSPSHSALLRRFNQAAWHGPTLSLDHVQYQLFPAHCSTRKYHPSLQSFLPPLLSLSPLPQSPCRRLLLSISWPSLGYVDNYDHRFAGAWCFAFHITIRRLVTPSRSASSKRTVVKIGSNKGRVGKRRSKKKVRRTGPSPGPSGCGPRTNDFRKTPSTRHMMPSMTRFSHWVVRNVNLSSDDLLSTREYQKLKSLQRA